MKIIFTCILEDVYSSLDELISDIISYCERQNDLEEEIEEAPEDWENPDSWTKEVVERFICVNPDFLGDYSGFPALNDYEDPFSAKIEE